MSRWTLVFFVLLCSFVCGSELSAATLITESTFFNFESGAASDFSLNQNMVLSPSDTATNPWIVYGGLNSKGQPNFPYYFNDQVWGASIFVPTQSGTVTSITLDLKPSSVSLTPQQVIVALCPKTGDNKTGLVSFMSCDLYSTQTTSFKSTTDYTTITYTNPVGFYTNGKVTAGTPVWVLVTPGDGNFAPVAPAGSHVDVKTVPAVDSTQVLSSLTGFYFTLDGVTYPFVNSLLSPVAFANVSPAKSFKMKGQGVLDVADGSCGTANGQILTQTPTTQAQLCTVGTPGAVTTNANSEYVWSCTGRGTGKASQCKTWNGKSDQSPLALVYKRATMTRGAGMIIKTQGGQGSGAVIYAVNNQGATACWIKKQSVGKGNYAYYLRAGNKKGTCAVIASKAADGSYNSSSSSAITFTIR